MRDFIGGTNFCKITSNYVNYIRFGNCNVFCVLGYIILEPYFESYNIDLLILASIILLISHHVFAALFNLYHRAWEYASVNELMLVVKAVSSSVLTTLIVVSLITGSSPFFRLYFITWMMHLILIGGSRLFWRVYRKYIIGKNIKRNQH